MRFLFVAPRDTPEPSVPEILSEYGVCDVSSDPQEIMVLCDYNEYDALILSSGLNTKECMDLCKELREQNTSLPVIRLASKLRCGEKVKLLLSGVDVYLSANASAEEFYAELSVMLRRNNKSNIKDPIVVKGFSFSILKRALYYGKDVITLRKKEYELLEYLFLNRGKLVSKETILEHVWEEGIDVESNTLEVHIRNLRNRFKKYTNEEIIETRRGLGYIIPA